MMLGQCHAQPQPPKIPPGWCSDTAWTRRRIQTHPQALLLSSSMTNPAQMAGQDTNKTTRNCTWLITEGGWVSWRTLGCEESQSESPQGSQIKASIKTSSCFENTASNAYCGGARLQQPAQRAARRCKGSCCKARLCARAKAATSGPQTSAEASREPQGSTEGDSSHAVASVLSQGNPRAPGEQGRCFSCSSPRPTCLCAALRLCLREMRFTELSFTSLQTIKT